MADSDTASWQTLKLFHKESVEIARSPAAATNNLRALGLWIIETPVGGLELVRWTSGFSRDFFVGVKKYCLTSNH
jgi:hypothetical protein